MRIYLKNNCFNPIRSEVTADFILIRFETIAYRLFEDCRVSVVWPQQ